MKRNNLLIAGFTLMEINLVLFLFGAGITAILGIFPVGLRQAQYAFSDTVQVAFATKVLSSLESRAMEMCGMDKKNDSSRACWNNVGRFKSEILKNVKVNNDEVDIKATTGDKGILIQDYLSEGCNIRYCLEFTQLDENQGALPYRYETYGGPKPPPRYRAALWVIDMKSGKPKTTKPYIADFQYYELISDQAEDEGED